MNISNYIKCIGFISMFILGMGSFNISASLKDEWRYSADRMWHVCTHKLPKLALMGAKGAVTICSFYLFCKWGYRTVEECGGLKDSHSTDLLKRILEKGCLTAGVGLLAYEAGGSFLGDLEES